MPKLIQKISGDVYDIHEGVISSSNLFDGQFGNEDYISVYGFKAYVQDFSKTPIVDLCPAQVNYGLKNNTTFVEIEISY